MFGSSYKSQYIGGEREKFVRLDDLDSTLSMSSDRDTMKKCGFNFKGFTSAGHRNNNPSKSIRIGMEKGSAGIMTFGRSLRSGVTRAVFPEDLKMFEKLIFDPQDKSLMLWNRLFVISCILAVAVDPFFLYLPQFRTSGCLGIDENLAKTSITLRSVLDSFYLIRMALQFRTAYIAPSSRVFGRGELVIDPPQIAKRYLLRYFIVDFLSVLPLPQIVAWRFLHDSQGSAIIDTKKALLFVVMIQYFPRFIRFLPLISELKKTAGVFAESAWAGAAYYLLWYMLASHLAGASWYTFAIERMNTCWQIACNKSEKCKNLDYLYCDTRHRVEGFDRWKKISGSFLDHECYAEDENSRFNYGIYMQAISSKIVYNKLNFFSKFCYCLWWGLQNLSTLGQGLKTSTYPKEVLFSIFLAILGLLLFALLIGKMQTYLQSASLRLEEMRIKRRDSEQWMHHRLLPHDLRERVRRYDRYKWLETRGVDEESLVQSLPKDLRRDIKRHLCLQLVKRVPLFANMDERLLDAICERLKPSLCTEQTCIIREGDPVDEMLFIIRGRLESITTDGGRSGFFNKGYLKDGDFCGEELLTWALDPKAGSSLPSSTRTVKALTEVEAFALEAEELKFVASQFRRLHSRQVQQTFRFYSQQWRTWASCFIQAAWRRHARRKLKEQRYREMEEDEEEEEEYNDEDSSRALIGPSDNSSSLGATILASRFAARALRGHKLRSTSMMKLQKPSEPDFTVYDY